MRADGDFFSGVLDVYIFWDYAILPFNIYIYIQNIVEQLHVNLKNVLYEPPVTEI